MNGPFMSSPDCRRCSLHDEIARLQAIVDKPVTNIRICKLPYHKLPFVHGARDGKDVWLLPDGQWTEEEGQAWIPFYDAAAEAAAREERE